MLAVLTPSWLEFKRRVFSHPPFFHPGEQGWSGGERTAPIHLRPSLKSCDTPACANAFPKCERSGPTDVSRSERFIKWQLWRRQWGLQAVALRDEMDQILNCISQASAATAPSPSSSTEIKYSFQSGPLRSHLITFKSAQTFILSLLFIYLLFWIQYQGSPNLSSFGIQQAING